MLMKYRDGTQEDDYLFDQPEDLHRVYIAGCLSLNPAAPEDWPMDLIERLLFIRQYDGLKAFHRELRRTLSPCWPMIRAPAGPTNPAPKRR